MNQENESKIKAQHTFGWKGIIEIVRSRKYHRKVPFKVSIGFAMVAFVIAALNRNESYNILMIMVSINLSIFPSLTGFSLTAFSICINFGNMAIAKNSVKVGSLSIYQKAIGVFAFSIVIQIAVLISSYLLKLFDAIPKLEVCRCLNWLINSVGITILTFITSFALFLIFTIVSNIFTFGQLNNLQNTKDKIQDAD
jgi:hypothetical protein